MVGIILVNKPAGVSSYHVVARIKKLVNVRGTKIGHAGTLDPFATGLLIIGIGREATKLLTALTHADKTYVATGKLGSTTDTLDYTGEVIEERPWEHITPAMVEAQCVRMIGPYEQVPPIYSALKIQGKRLYKLARKQHLPTDVLHELAEQKKRMVIIRDLDIMSVSLPEFMIKARVSHGTYIRVLVDDIARSFDSCAVTTVLERTAIGQFKLDAAITLEELVSPEVLEHHLFSVEQVCDLLAE